MKWEYLVVSLGLDRQGDLNRYGKSGWELVAVIFEEEDVIAPTAYLKRPIAPKSQDEILTYFDKNRSSLV